MSSLTLVGAGPSEGLVHFGTQGKTHHGAQRRWVSGHPPKQSVRHEELCDILRSPRISNEGPEER